MRGGTSQEATARRAAARAVDSPLAAALRRGPAPRPLGDAMRPPGRVCWWPNHIPAASACRVAG